MDQAAQAINDLVRVALSIELVEMLIQISATLLLVIIVRFFFWNKVTAFIDARKAYIDKELTDAAERNEEASMLKEEAEKAFEQVKLEARQLLDDAKTRAEDQRRELLVKAKEEAINIKKSAKQDLNYEIDQARAKLRQEIIDVATVLAQKVIDKEIDKKTYDRLIDQAIEEVQSR
ncbi:MAG: F0F1 ATP synthase subunit B [Candidatus Izemoplasmataceae bacterium]